MIGIGPVVCDGALTDEVDTTEAVEREQRLRLELVKRKR